jgi:hypothetical protein
MGRVVIGNRQVRAIGLIAAAMLAVAAVSFTYLRPPAAPHVARAAAASTPGVTWTQTVVVQQINLTGRLDGGFFVWARPGTGSGGHDS